LIRGHLSLAELRAPVRNVEPVLRPQDWRKIYMKRDNAISSLGRVYFLTMNETRIYQRLGYCERRAGFLRCPWYVA
jgi:hypothetical protein